MSAINQVVAALGGSNTDLHYKDSPGTYSFTVPAGVTSISMLALGAGAGGLSSEHGSYPGRGGGGGGLSYSNGVSVTPGETLTLVIGAGGAPGTGTSGYATDGGATQIKRGGTVLVEATGGRGSSGSGFVGGNYSGTGTGTVKYVGGTGGAGSGDAYKGGQGGAAATTAANGADGAAGTSGATLYRGGNYGNTNGMWTTFDQFAHYSPGAQSSTRNGGGAADANYYHRGFGGGGGAYGDAGYTLVGAGATGGDGLAILLWGGRTFSSANSF